MRGCSTEVVVTSLGGPGQSPLHHVQCSSQGSRVGAWNIVLGWLRVCRGFDNFVLLSSRDSETVGLDLN